MLHQCILDPTYEARGWIYLVRCCEGYELPSVLAPDQQSVKELSKLASFREQEIAVPGAICGSTSSAFDACAAAPTAFLTGPVFLRDEAYWTHYQDLQARDSLFRQFSGKSG
jgi:hypothetical protein